MDDSPQAERRQLTVMFCDLVGSTALAERFDPEDLGEVISAFQNTCARVIGRFDGYVARYMGDGLLVYFGYPTAHEDCAERAVRAGLDVVQAVGAIELTARLKLQVRVGIATGLVVAGELIGKGAAEERSVLGGTPNLAARLQALALPDTVLIAVGTKRLVEGLFVLEAQAPQRVKGFEEPVHAYRVQGESDARSRFEAGARRGLTPLVGRSEELGLLLKRWAQAKDGEGQVVLLSGEPGLGKSRMARALRESLEGESSDCVLYYGSPYYQNSAFYPVNDQLERALRFEKGEGAEQKLEKLDAVLDELHLPARELAPLLAALLSVPAGDRYGALQLAPDELKRRTLEALIRLVEAMAAQRPVLLIAEDLHWIDPSTLELLTVLVERVRSTRVLMLLTFRPEFRSPWSGHEHVTELALKRLSRGENALMVKQLTEGTDMPEGLLAQIVARTDGVPLFAEELTKAVLESDLARELEVRSGAGDTSPALAIPETLQDSLMARLDRLAPVKEVAQFAAILGRSFTRELITAVWPGMENELEDALAQLVEAGLIYRRGHSPDTSYEFKHALVQDAAYGSLLKSRRRQYHMQIARALEAQFPETAASQPQLLAYHFTEAGLADEAVPYWRRAGERAVERSAYLEAIAHLLRGLEVLQTLRDSNDSAAHDLAMNVALATAMRIVDRYDEAFAALDRAQETAQKYGLLGDLAEIHHLRGNLYFPQGRIEACQREHERALEIARSTGSSQGEVRALGGLGDAAYACGRMKTAKHYFSQCVERSRQHGFSDIAAANLSMIGFSRMYLNDFDGAHADGQAAVELARHMGHERAELLGEVILLNITCDRFELDQARGHLERANALVNRLGASRFAAENFLFEGRLRRAEGRRSETSESLAKALEISRETGVAYLGPWILATLALEAGSPEERRRCLEEGERILGQGALSHNHFWFYREAMEACVESREWDHVEHYAAALLDYARDEPLPWTDFFVARGRALASFGRGVRDDSLLAELRNLRAEAERVGLIAALPALEAALATE